MREPGSIVGGGDDWARVVGTVITFDDELHTRLHTNLAGHDRRAHDLAGRKHAAVAIVVVDSLSGEDRDDPLIPEDWQMTKVPGETAGLDGRMLGVAGGAAFLLCRRTSRLNAHSGQWALPGGRLDSGESPVDAALRELDEEVGLRLGSDSVIGLLDDYPTRSGYVITPVVVWGGDDARLVPSPDEVAAVYRIGLHALASGEPRFITIPESDRPVIQLPIGKDLIHAPTGAVLLQFRWVAMEARANERVDHLEQPVFAWR